MIASARWDNDRLGHNHPHVEQPAGRLMSITNPLKLTSLRERLRSKYIRLKKSGVIKKKDDEETVLAGKGFLGRCSVCGEFGHKGAKFPDKEKEKNQMWWKRPWKWKRQKPTWSW